MPAFAIMLRTLMCQETGAQKHRMLAVLLTQGIHTFVQVRKPLHADGFSKEIKLAVVGLGELQEDDPGGAVRSRRIEEVLEGLRHSPENVIGKLRGSGEMALVPFDEDQHVFELEALLCRKSLSLREKPPSSTPHATAGTCR